MKDVLASILDFLEASGLLSGRIPPEHFSRGGIVCVKEPVDIVRLGIQTSHPGKRYPFQDVLAGVSIGAHPRECLPTVPDMVLGVLRGNAWEWVGAQPGHVVNLHSADDFKYIDGLPVWLTFAHCPGARAELVRSRAEEFDLFHHVLERKRRRFWASAYEEFIGRTWHPSRLAWCMDVDEYREIFSPVHVNGLAL